MAGRDPVMHALVLADNVVPDPNSGKNFILGTITEFRSRKLPARMNQISIYLCIGDAQDCRQPTVEVVDLKDEEVLIKKKLPPLPKKPRGDVLELSISFGGVRFPEYGPYEFRVWMDGKYIGGRKLTISPWPEQR
jgi:hypothetical protein